MKTVNAILALLLIFTIPVTAAAASSESADLTVQIQWERQPLPEVPVEIYRIQDMDEAGNLTTRDSYAGISYLPDIRDAHAEQWKAAALALEGFIRESGLPPEGTALTNAAGTAKFSALPRGLYLVMGTRTRQEGWLYSTAPFFALVPGQDIHAKVERVPEKISLQVIKQWFDQGGEECRPTQIRVQLHRDGKLFEVVTLREEENWTYTWDDLDAACHWSVKEEPVQGYSGTGEQQGNVVILRNYLEKGEEIRKLPQTGQLWWPVPMLTLAGLALVLLGLLHRKKDG